MAWACRERQAETTSRRRSIADPKPTCGQSSNAFRRPSPFPLLYGYQRRTADPCLNGDLHLTVYRHLTSLKLRCLETSIVLGDEKQMKETPKAPIIRNSQFLICLITSNFTIR